MNARILALLLSFLPAAAGAQGFAGLGSDAEGYALPDPATRFAFPADHGPHPGFRIEWWYVTATLDGADGETYGVQWTLFRNALAPGGDPERQAWMGHAAVSTPGAHLSAERLARGGIGQAGVEADPFDAWIDEWRMTGPTLSDVSLTAQGPDWAYDLALSADRPFVPQGAEGYSVKSEAGQASHYYSQPFYEVSGTITLPTGPIAVIGEAWLDREWSSQPLTGTQTGWDWMSLHLDDGHRLMGYRLRDADGAAYTVGTWIAPDGTPEPLEPGALTMEPLRLAEVEGREVPVDWRVELPSRSLDVHVRALRDDSWMRTRIPYWEGPVEVSGTHGGRGYLEMSGYAPPRQDD